MSRRTSLLATLTAAVTIVAVGSGPAGAVNENGTAGNDTLKGTNRADTLRGKGGHDKIFGYSGQDLLLGGPGNDNIKGGKGLDEIGGGKGNDRLISGLDNRLDRVHGNFGRDTLFVRGGDLADGGSGNDKVVATYPSPGMEIFCGPGEDSVVFNEQADEVQTHDCEHIDVISAG
jgi:Ca2+-binding RTX toxin-like protein